ncbi:MAG TPA: OmpA family protein, partial [Planctomycetota bacterium]|nr:OmpA family protein [Planctomycetota bacterium]
MLPIVVAWASVGSGCALKNLREANDRLRESNSRLVAENNRLEHELGALQARLGSEPMTAVVAASSPAPEPMPIVERSAPLAPTLDADMFPDPDSTPEIVRSPDGIVFRFPDRVFFGLGQAKLSKQGQDVLERMASLLKTRYKDYVVRVDGHTDDVPIRKLRHLYPSNWELSTARACTVVRYLVETANINPDRIYPAGFA